MYGFRIYPVSVNGVSLAQCATRCPDQSPPLQLPWKCHVLQKAHQNLTWYFPEIKHFATGYFFSSFFVISFHQFPTIPIIRIAQKTKFCLKILFSASFIVTIVTIVTSSSQLWTIMNKRSMPCFYNYVTMWRWFTLLYVRSISSVMCSSLSLFFSFFSLHRVK